MSNQQPQSKQQNLSMNSFTSNDESSIVQHFSSNQTTLDPSSNVSPSTDLFISHEPKATPTADGSHSLQDIKTVSFDLAEQF